MPLYISLLYKVMKAKGIHEGTLEQMDRLFRTKLYAGQPVPVDSENRIRMDDWELRDDVQAEVEKLWETVTTENGTAQADIEGYRSDFHRLYGFAMPGVDYKADVPDSAI
jgi:enoyl-[acyl-carrier protein] reductase/trans-2-enoyl-CoA reductase (NAD+)